MPISRMFSSAADASAAVHDMAEDGLREGRAHVLTAASDNVDALVKLGVSEPRARDYADQLSRGGALVVVDAPFGFGLMVTKVLEQQRPGDTGTPMTSYDGVDYGLGLADGGKPGSRGAVPGDDATPLSSALGWAVLLDDPAPFSRWLGWPLLAKSQAPRAKLLDDPAPLSSKVGWGLLTGNPAPLSTAIGMQVLSSDPAPLSSAIGMNPLSNNAAPLSSALGWPVLSRNPTPLSSAVGWPVLKDDKRPSA